jgi:hypothetical protein
MPEAPQNGRAENLSNLSNPSNRELRAYLATYMAGAAFRAPFASSAAVRSIADDV